MLEELNVEVHEDIYLACNLNEQDVISSKSSEYFKSYFSSNSSYLCSLIETKEFVVQGTNFSDALNRLTKIRLFTVWSEGFLYSCSAGAKNFIKCVFYHVQFSGVIQNIAYLRAIKTKFWKTDFYLIKLIILIIIVIDK